MFTCQNFAVEDERECKSQQPGVAVGTPEAEIEVNKAVQRVYQHYGQNLAAFFQDVQTEIRREEKRQLPLFKAAVKCSSA